MATNLTGWIQPVS